MQVSVASVAYARIGTENKEMYLSFWNSHSLDVNSRKRFGNHLKTSVWSSGQYCPGIRNIFLLSQACSQLSWPHAPRVPLFSETRKNGKKVRQELVHECRCYRQQIEITGENRKKEEERKNLEKWKNDQENKIEKTSAGANKWKLRKYVFFFFFAEIFSSYRLFL